MLNIFRYLFSFKGDSVASPRYVQREGDWKYTQETCEHPLSWQTWGICEGCGRYDTYWTRNR